MPVLHLERERIICFANMHLLSVIHLSLMLNECFPHVFPHVSLLLDDTVLQSTQLKKKVWFFFSSLGHYFQLPAKSCDMAAHSFVFTLPD